MTEATAERWVVISAVTVAGVYAYRRMVEPSSTTLTKGQLIGVGNPPQLGRFAVGWGFTYLVVAAMASAAPGLGGGFAILIMTSYLLTNGAHLFEDVGKQQEPQQSTERKLATGEVGASQGFFDTPSGPAIYKPPTGVPTVGADPPAMTRGVGGGHPAGA